MGLAASQARLLTITSRLSNTELRQQQIANTKMRLSADQEQVSTKYSNALNNQTLTLNDAPMTYSDLVAAGHSVVRTSDGAYAGAAQTASNKSFEQMLNNSDFLIQGILSGYLTLMKDGQQVSLAGSKEISTVYDKSDDAQAEAEYNAAMAKINRKEKALDSEMKRLDTEHSALQTELESIKSIISDHAGKDFNLFS